MSSSQSFLAWVAEHPGATALTVLVAVVWLRRLLLPLALAVVVTLVVVGALTVLGGAGS